MSDNTPNDTDGANESNELNESNGANESNGGNAKKPTDISPELQAKLNEYSQALASEFSIANKELSNTSEITDLKDFWRSKVPSAAAQIAWLAGNAHSEGVRLNANKYILSEAFSETGSDELADILKSLHAGKVRQT